jgi:hypothetical protein
VVSTPVAGFRDADDPRVQVVPASMFPAAVAAAVPAVARFPDGADATMADWDDRAAAMRHVIETMPRP